MTREELEALVLFVRQHRSKGHPPYEAIIQLADERDEAERQLAAVMEMRDRDAPLWDRLGDVAKTLLSTDATELSQQRDRALALLRCYVDGGTYDEWIGDVRALLAEVGK